MVVATTSDTEKKNLGEAAPKEMKKIAQHAAGAARGRSSFRRGRKKGPLSRRWPLGRR